MVRYRGEIEKGGEVANFRAPRMSELVGMSAFWHKADITAALNHVRFRG